MDGLEALQFSYNFNPARKWISAITFRSQLRSATTLQPVRPTRECNFVRPAPGSRIHYSAGRMQIAFGMEKKLIIRVVRGWWRWCHWLLRLRWHEQQIRGEGFAIKILKLKNSARWDTQRIEDGSMCAAISINWRYSPQAKAFSRRLLMRSAQIANRKLDLRVWARRNNTAENNDAFLNLNLIKHAIGNSIKRNLGFTHVSESGLSFCSIKHCTEINESKRTCMKLSSYLCRHKLMCYNKMVW